MPDPTIILGYISGIHFIKPDLDPDTLLRTVFLVHFLDAILCWLLAGLSGRHKPLWALASLVLGMWALGTLILLTDKRRKNRDSGLGN